MYFDPVVVNTGYSQTDSFYTSPDFVKNVLRDTEGVVIDQGLAGQPRDASVTTAKSYETR